MRNITLYVGKMQGVGGLKPKLGDIACTELFKMIVGGVQLHRWIKKFSKFSFMMGGVQ